MSLREVTLGVEVDAPEGTTFAELAATVADELGIDVDHVASVEEV